MGPAQETKFATKSLEWAQHRLQKLPPKTLNGPSTIRCQNLSMGPEQFDAEQLEWAQHRKQKLLPKVLNGPSTGSKICHRKPCMGPAQFAAKSFQWAQHSLV